MTTSNEELSDLMNRVLAVLEAVLERLEGEGQAVKVAEFDEGLYQDLRAWRRRVANADGLLPFQVFPDTVLKEIVAKKPGSVAEFSKIRGVGERRLQYGPEVIAIIQSNAW